MSQNILVVIEKGMASYACSIVLLFRYKILVSYANKNFFVEKTSFPASFMLLGVYLAKSGCVHDTTLKFVQLNS